MTLAQLKYVYETFKVGSISKAAENLYISQPVLSVSISKLEAELGEEIFIRSSRGVVPTPFGKTFISHIIPIIEQSAEIDKLILRPKEKRQESIKIVSYGYFFLSSLLARIINRHKDTNIRVEYFEMLDNEGLSFVTNHIADIGFARRFTCYQKNNKKLYDSMGLQFFPLFKGDIGVVVTPKNPLFFSDSNQITTDMLADHVPIIYNASDSLPFSDLFDRLGISKYSSRILVNSRSTLYEMANNTDSYFITTVMDSTESKIRTDDLKVPQRTLTISNCDFKSEFGWYKRKDYNPSYLLLELIQDVTEYCSSEFVLDPIDFENYNPG